MVQRGAWDIPTEMDESMTTGIIEDDYFIIPLSSTLRPQEGCTKSSQNEILLGITLEPDFVC